MNRHVAIRSTFACVLVAMILLCGCNKQRRVLHTAKMSVMVDGREIVNQNDLVKIGRANGYDRITFSVVAYTQFSFSELAAKRLHDETNAHVGKQLEVVVDGILLYSKVIKKATSSILLDYSHGSEDEWKEYFFGEGNVDVSHSIRNADDL